MAKGQIEVLTAQGTAEPPVPSTGLQEHPAHGSKAETSASQQEPARVGREEEEHVARHASAVEACAKEFQLAKGLLHEAADVRFQVDVKDSSEATRGGAQPKAEDGEPPRPPEPAEAAAANALAAVEGSTSPAVFNPELLMQHLRQQMLLQQLQLTKQGEAMIHEHFGRGAGRR